MVSGANSDEHQAWYKSQDIYRAIKSLPSAEPKTVEWIPVSEKLPEKDELVLVTVWNDVVTAWRNRYGGWESAEDMYEKGDVTAWMHLPEPYRKDGEA
jgi:hypothetical protein